MSVRWPPSWNAITRSSTVRFSVGTSPLFVTHTSPSTQIESVPALFVTATVYVLVPDWPVCSEWLSGVTDLSIVHSNVRVQCPSAVFVISSGVVAIAVGAKTAATTAASASSAAFPNLPMVTPCSTV
jgi:hypothetical protein